MKYNYGECEICNAKLVRKRIKQDFWIRGKLVVIDNVPAGVCPRCGPKSYDHKLENALRRF